MYISIKDMVEAGYSSNKIANKFKLSLKEVIKEIEENNYKLTKEQFDSNKIEYICELYKSGVSAKQLGIKYSIDKRRVQKWANERGNLRTLEESHRITFFNEHKMDIIDEPAKAYWLGMCMADVYNADMICTFSLTLQGKDVEHVKKFARFLDYPEDKTDRHTRNDGADTANIKLYSKYFCTKMTEQGCPRAKSFITEYPKWLPEDLHNHFIRGLFDGDGCITFRTKQKEWKWSLAGTKDICDNVAVQIKKKANANSSIGNISKTGNNTYCMDTAGNEQIKRILDWLYLGATSEMWLDRKHEKYLQLCEQQANRKHRKQIIE